MSKNPFDIAKRELTAVGLGQRLNIIRASFRVANSNASPLPVPLLPRPAVLIAGTDPGNLDTETGRQIADLLFAKQAERGMTLLLVTHDNSLAARCSRQIRVPLW